MKKIVFILLAFPCLVLAQRDFEERFFTMNAETLPDVDIDLSSFNLGTPITPFAQLKTFRMNTKNYQVPVDMMTALAKKQQFIDREWQGSRTTKKEKSIQFSVQVRGDNDNNDWSNTNSNFRVRNSVYNQLRVPYYYSPLEIYSVQQ